MENNEGLLQFPGTNNLKAIGKNGIFELQVTFLINTNYIRPNIKENCCEGTEKSQERTNLLEGNCTG
jgi:hypothetical protein